MLLIFLLIVMLKLLHKIVGFAGALLLSAISTKKISTSTPACWIVVEYSCIIFRLCFWLRLTIKDSILLEILLMDIILDEYFLCINKPTSSFVSVSLAIWWKWSPVFMILRLFASLFQFLSLYEVRLLCP